MVLASPAAWSSSAGKCCNERRHRVYLSAAIPADGGIASEWGTSERTKFYSVTMRGLKQLANGDGKLGADLRPNRPRAEDCGAGVTRCSGV